MEGNPYQKYMTQGGQGQTQPQVPKSREEQIQHLHEMISNTRFAMVTTIGDDGNIYSRPMGILKIEHDSTAWFFTYANTGKCGDINRDSHINISFSDISKHQNISLSGRAELSRDIERMKELWSPHYKPWFPKGLEEPELALLRVAVEKAEYWDSPISSVVKLEGLSKPPVKDEKGETHPNVENGPLAGQDTKIQYTF